MSDDPDWYHVGYPISDEEIVATVRKGLPAYVPGDPKMIKQTEYLRFAEKRGPNSE